MICFYCLKQLHFLSYGINKERKKERKKIITRYTLIFGNKNCCVRKKHADTQKYFHSIKMKFSYFTLERLEGQGKRWSIFQPHLGICWKNWGKIDSHHKMGNEAWLKCISYIILDISTWRWFKAIKIKLWNFLYISSLCLYLFSLLPLLSTVEKSYLWSLKIEEICVVWTSS